MLIRMERFKEWTGLKSDLTNYRLNSSIHMTQPVSISTGKPPFWGPSEGVLPRLPEVLILHFCLTIQYFE